MDRQPPVIEIVRLVAEQVEKLALQHGNDEIEGGIGIAHNEEQRRFPVAHRVKLQFVLRHNVPQLLDIEGGEAGTAAHQNAFECLARNELSRTFYQKNKQQYYLLHYACCVCHLAV